MSKPKRGPGRPPGPPQTSVTGQFPAARLPRLRAECKRQGTTPGRLIRTLLLAWLDNPERKES